MNFKYRQWAGIGGCALVGFTGASTLKADVPNSVDDSGWVQLASNEDFGEGELVFGEEFAMDDTNQSASADINNKQLFGGSRRFIYQHDLAYIFSEPEGVASNRSSLRFQWHKIVWEKLYLNVDVKPIAYFKEDDALNENEEWDSSFKTKELYSTLTLGNTSITLGEKIIIWGESESSPVTDILSPQNIQDLVFTSVDESRISQTMLEIEQYMGNHQFSFIVNPDIKVDEQPAVAQIGLPTEIEDKDAEVGMRWKAPIGRGDFSLMLADVVDNTSVPVYKQVGSQPEKLFFKGYRMIGAAANLNLGNTALQIESAYNLERAQALDEALFDPLVHPLGYGESDEFLLAVNMDYQENGLRDWTAGISHSEYLDYTNEFSSKERRTNELFLGVVSKFYHELIEVSLNYQYVLETEESIGQLRLSYRAGDNLSVSLDMFNLDNIEGSFEQSSSIARIIYNF